MWKIDPAHSFIEFSAKHLMFTTVRGRFHTVSGCVQLNEANPLLSSAEGMVETNSVDTREAARDAHLRSADFLDVEKFPTMKFRTTRIEAMGNNTYKVAGVLTIKDVTREVVFDVIAQNLGKDLYGNYRWGFSAETELNRKDFGLNFNAVLETGGLLVSDEIKIHIELQLIKEVETTTTPTEVTSGHLLTVP